MIPNLYHSARLGFLNLLKIVQFSDSFCYMINLITFQHDQTPFRVVASFKPIRKIERFSHMLQLTQFICTPCLFMNNLYIKKSNHVSTLAKFYLNTLSHSEHSRHCPEIFGTPLANGYVQ